MKIVAASDSFKESLSSAEVARAIADGIRRVSPDIETIGISVSDGGEGLVESLVAALDGRYGSAVVSDPLGRRIKARYGICGNTAIIEMAAASGLPLLSPDERNPMAASTYGTGELIADALSKGCREFLIGIGGSATCDAGMGMLEALGWKFLDRNGDLLHGCGENMCRIAAIDGCSVIAGLDSSRFTVACDVKNPFCGPQGASYVFSPQKGASGTEVALLDEGLRNFASVIASVYGIDVTGMEGAGAAGGLGAAFKAFLGANLHRGIDVVLDAIGTDDVIAGADLVITGEGRIDSQTVSGKTAAGVLHRCRRHGVPCVAIGGMVEMCDELFDAGFAGIFPIIARPCTLENALNREVAFNNVSRTASQIVSLFLAAKRTQSNISTCET